MFSENKHKTCTEKQYPFGELLLFPMLRFEIMLQLFLYTQPPAYASVLQKLLLMTCNLTTLQEEISSCCISLTATEASEEISASVLASGS